MVNKMLPARGLGRDFIHYSEINLCLLPFSLADARTDMMAGLKANKIAMYGGAASASVICCVLLVWWSTLVDIDPAVEKAYQRAIAKSTLFDLREITTFAYDDGDPQVGIARGRLDTIISSVRWAEVGWTCRINPESCQVMRAEIPKFQGVHNLKAAAAPFSSKR